MAQNCSRVRQPIKMALPHAINMGASGLSAAPPFDPTVAADHDLYYCY